MKTRLLFFGCALSLIFCCGVAHANVKLFDLFVDNVVLQRDSLAPVWGTADPAEPITLTLGDQTVKVIAGPDGTWRADLKGLKPGPAQTMTVVGLHNTVTINNVVVGDVWVTSGQSNMQYLLVDKDEIAAPGIPDIHYYEVPRAMSDHPLTTLPPRRPPTPWMLAAPDTKPKMSAVAYYFAKEVEKETGVPVGIIDTSWGGTPAEAWTSREAMESVPEYKDPIDKDIAFFQNQDANCTTFAADRAQWEQKFGRTDSGNTGFAAGWAASGFDASSWTTFTTSTIRNWASTGLPHGGAYWVRKKVALPPEAAGKDFTLTLGNVPGVDTAYFNGQEIGSGGWTSPGFVRMGRGYKVPGSLVKSGDNVIAIRIFSEEGRYEPFGFGAKLGLPVAPGTAVSDDWQFHVESTLPPLTDEALAAMPPYPHPGAGCSPTTNFNGMVCPLMPYGIKGVIWYQGESNVKHGYAYRTLLPLLIQSWRTHWGIGDFPFYIVQLPQLGNAPKLPDSTSNWAVLRESQLLTWKHVPHTGMSVNIDIGDPMNIHPADKKDVGHRLALIALADSYGRPVEDSGPIYDSMVVEGSTIRVKFAHPGGGLVAKDGPLKQFAIAGSDQNFVWADAKIDGDSVVVSCPTVSVPVAVRYAWAAYPQGCNLYNQAGLPASPFRTDDWPVVTQGLWYGEPPKAAEPPANPLTTPPQVPPSN